MLEVIQQGLDGLLSLVACVGGFSLLGLGGAFLMQPRGECNPYGVFPCECGPGAAD